MATQNAQMAHKVEVVDEVKTRIEAASASIVSEYRGLSVAEMAELRDALTAAGGDYRIFKNTLVRRAIDGGEYQPLSEYLSGPSALTFVQGDISAVAKALRDFSRTNPHLVIKGGLADGSLLSSSDLERGLPKRSGAANSESPTRHFTSEENYFPVFENNTRDLQSLEAHVVINITAFYTYMKAVRDSTRSLVDMGATLDLAGAGIAGPQHPVPGMKPRGTWFT